MAVSIRVLAGTLEHPGNPRRARRLRPGGHACDRGRAAEAAARPSASDTCRCICFATPIHLGAQYLWAMSLLLLPLATVFALEFTTPAWTLLLAVPVLGERLTRSRIGAVVLGLLGVLVILRPGLADVPAGRAARAGWRRSASRSRSIATKKLTTHRTHLRDHLLDERDPVAAGLDRLRSAVRDQAPVRPRCPPSSASALPGLSSHYCLTNAFRAGDASVVVPLDFMRIPLIAVIGWWLYGEPLDVFVFRRRRPDHHRHPVESAQRSHARRNDPAQPVSADTGFAAVDGSDWPDRRAGPGFPHFGHHSSASIVDCELRVGLHS